ncbi:hypothetical protein H5410_003004 [Solanum commersonii]|uniref:Uncharacterized protein n=1 Tax=Solanum commersonii TaxID=4109 RepID=A0A9J6B4H1_SOLCO|nr:hypothetical protein H5410_003004 [Solanum commersonii]
MVKIIEKRNRLSQSGNSMDFSYGGKEKKREPSRVFDDDDPNDVITTEEVVSMFNATYEVVSSTSSMCRTIDKFKEFTDTTSYSELKFESSIDAFQKNQRRVLKSPSF